MAILRRAHTAHLSAALFAWASLCACSSERPSELGEADLGAVRGELLMYIARYDDGASKTSYALRIDGSESDERQLIFDVDPGVASGTKLKVWGAENGEGFKVESFELDQADDPGTIEQGLISGAPYPARKFALVLLNLGGGVNLTNAQAQIDLFGLGPTDGSVKQYFLEASYGTQDITGEIIGPMNQSLTSCSNSATQAMANTLRGQIPGTFDHYLWYFGSRVATCGWAGLGAVGTPDRPARDTWYNAASSCTVLVQEPGHNFGMQHSSAMRCSGTPFRDDPNGCTHEEYGDRYDPMGGGCYHMNGWQKTYQGWTGKCNNVKVGASGTYTLFPLEKPCDGLQVLQIPMPRTRSFAAGGTGGNLGFYYLELRTPTGFDARLAGAPTVLVRVASDYRTRRQIGYRTWILDMNPSTTTLDGLKAGGMFADPAGGVSFSVEAISNEQATIRVEVQNGTGSSTCLDGSAFTPPGPASCTGLGTDGGIGGSSGTGGTGGSSGSAGTGGTGGSAGSAGTNGASGSAGSAGTSGSGGTGGGGSGGDAGSGGGVGSGGDGGVGGSGFGGTGAGGSGGGTQGASGAPAGGAQGNPGEPPVRERPGATLGLNEEESGCACNTPRAVRFDTAGWLLAALGLLGPRRRRATP